MSPVIIAAISYTTVCDGVDMMLIGVIVIDDEIVIQVLRVCVCGVCSVCVCDDGDGGM